MAAVDTATAVADILAVGSAVGAVGGAVLLIYVAISTFQWLKMVLGYGSGGIEGWSVGQGIEDDLSDGEGALYGESGQWSDWNETHDENHDPLYADDDPFDDDPPDPDDPDDPRNYDHDVFADMPEDDDEEDLDREPTLEEAEQMAQWEREDAERDGLL